MRVLKFEDRLDDPGVYCCPEMRAQLVGFCRGAEKHTTGTEQCPKQYITYDGSLDEYTLSPVTLPYTYMIRFCPFCGTKLPESKRFDPEFDPGSDTLV